MHIAKNCSLKWIAWLFWDPLDSTLANQLKFIKSAHEWSNRPPTGGNLGPKTLWHLKSQKKFEIFENFFRNVLWVHAKYTFFNTQAKTTDLHEKEIPLLRAAEVAQSIFKVIGRVWKKFALKKVFSEHISAFLENVDFHTKCSKTPLNGLLGTYSGIQTIQWRRYDVLLLT